MDTSYAAWAYENKYAPGERIHEKFVPTVTSYHSGRYGSMPGVVGGKPTMAALKQQINNSKRPPIPALVGMLFVPWLIFVVVYYLRSFDMHYHAAGACNACSFVLLVPVAVFAFMTFNLAKNGSDPVPMAITTLLTLGGWLLGSALGEASYSSFMRPFYELSELNSYPRIDPTTWQGSQLMDAGMIEFRSGARLNLRHSMGFKNDNIYCVAPVVMKNITTDEYVTQDHYDFWAVGINCCSGHVPDFQCGEYSNPMARWGLRVMDYEARDNYRLAVQQAEAAFNLKAPHPIFMHWMNDPQSEVEAYREDGNKYFMTSAIMSFCVLSAVVIGIFFLLQAM